VDVVAVTRGLAQVFTSAAGTEAGGAEPAAGLTINLFWIVVSALNFLVFFAIVSVVVLRPVGGMLATRRQRIEQGLRDADAARRDREAAADQRQAILAEARRDANEILARAQRLAEESRDQELAGTRAEIERLRAQAVAEIDTERQRALADVRAQVADLALLAAGKVVGETLTDERQRRLVTEFLSEVTAAPPTGGARN
jgi:F-type H+-transporting ATPase subunit b